MKIGYLQKTSLIDYPGKICSTVFTQGCNFRCPYCHNPELVDPALFGESLPSEEILSFLSLRKGKIDAVTVTGGEPTIHTDLPRFIRSMKDLGYLIKIDTNGSNPGMLRQIVSEGLADFIAMDIKSPLGRYPDVAGVVCDARTVESSIQTVMASGAAYEFRTTIVDGLLSPGDIIEIGRTIQGASRYVLQKFAPSKHLDNEYLKAGSFSDKELEDLLGHLNALVGHVSVR